MVSFFSTSQFLNFCIFTVIDNGHGQRYFIREITVSDIKEKLKEMLVKRLKLKMTAQDIKDDVPLFGEGGLGLDSIDALELVVGLQKEFNVVINDKSVAEKVLVSVNSIVGFIEEK
ncbi:MAG: acyl carrier protein [Deltaproteobacteria bacterium]|nr:acyl carrier protein [Deltaproteobacteria bacterium]